MSRQKNPHSHSPTQKKRKLPVVYPHGNKVEGHKLSLKFKKRKVDEKLLLNLQPHVEKKKFSLPSQVDLSSQTGPIRNQKSLGCCVSFSMSTTCRYLLCKEKEKSYLFSPLFLYYYTRVGEIGEAPSLDSGSTLQEAVNALTQYGICREKFWKYDPTLLATPPPDEACEDAATHKLVKVAHVAQNLTSIQSCLAAGFPVNVGIAVFPSFEAKSTTETGIVPLPSPDEKPLGGHAVVLVGYDNSTQHFTVQNSWGTEVGNGGLYYIRYEYITNENLCSEIFCLTEFENSNNND